MPKRFYIGRPATVLGSYGALRRQTRLAFSEPTLEQDGGEIVAEARAVIAYVKDTAT